MGRGSNQRLPLYGQRATRSAHHDVVDDLLSELWQRGPSNTRDRHRGLSLWSTPIYRRNSEECWIALRLSYNDSRQRLRLVRVSGERPTQKEVLLWSGKQSRQALRAARAALGELEASHQTDPQIRRPVPQRRQWRNLIEEALAQA